MNASQRIFLSKKKRSSRYSGMTTRELLVTYARLMNEFGPDSEEAAAFVRANSIDADFVELAALSRLLKGAFLFGAKNHEIT